MDADPTKPYRSLYPRTAAWFDQLPIGQLAAFPQCEAHSRLPAAIERDYPQVARLPDMPRPWRLALAGQPFAAEWVPETVLVLQYLLLRDACFINDEAFFAATKERVKASFNSPTMRAVMARVSPHLLVLGSGMRWSQYHRGTTLQARSTSLHALEATLKYPPALYPPLMLQDTCVAIAASIELAHKTPDLNYELLEPGLCRIRGSWTEATHSPGSDATDLRSQTPLTY